MSGRNTLRGRCKLTMNIANDGFAVTGKRSSCAEGEESAQDRSKDYAAHVEEME